MYVWLKYKTQLKSLADNDGKTHRKQTKTARRTMKRNDSLP